MTALKSITINSLTIVHKVEFYSAQFCHLIGLCLGILYICRTAFFFRISIFYLMLIFPVALIVTGPQNAANLFFQPTVMSITNIKPYKRKLCMENNMDMVSVCMRSQNFTVIGPHNLVRSGIWLNDCNITENIPLGTTNVSAVSFVFSDVLRVLKRMHTPDGDMRRALLTIQWRLPLQAPSVFFCLWNSTCASRDSRITPIVWLASNKQFVTLWNTSGACIHKVTSNNSCLDLDCIPCSYSCQQRLGVIVAWCVQAALPILQGTLALLEPSTFMEAHET
jgi:hypothetical protein